MNDSMKPDDEVGIALGSFETIQCQLCNQRIPKEDLAFHWEHVCSYFNKEKK